MPSQTFWSSLDSRVRALAVFGFVVLTSFIPAGGGAWLAVAGFVFVAFSFASGAPIRPGLRAAAAAGALTLATLLAGRFMGAALAAALGSTAPRPDWGRLRLAPVKAALNVSAVGLLVWNGALPGTLDALRRMGVPGTLTEALAMGVERIETLRDEARRMRRAAEARGYSPRGLRDAAPLGGLAGALFLRAHARAERIHMAMLARGHDLREVPPAAAPLRSRDWVFAVLCAAALIGIGAFAFGGAGVGSGPF